MTENDKLTIFAPAKLNLTLEVLGRRPDGYHEIKSVVQTIDLGDTLSFAPHPGLEFQCALPEWSAEKSLVSKAAQLLREAAGSTRGALVTIEKHIPLVSGLGGDSSDAAAALKGLNRLWGLGLSEKDLAGLAQRLGSDVPFFIYGGTALAEGRGEKLTPLPPPRPVWVVLLVPPLPRPPEKTRQLYSRLTPAHFSDGGATRKMVAQLKQRGIIDQSLLFNVFDSVADESFAGLGRYRQRLVDAGAGTVHLAGSGPTLFTLTGEEAEAKTVFQRLKGQNLEAYLTKTG